MAKKNILVFEAYSVFSGAQRVSLNICKILKKNNANITLLLADDASGILRKKFGPYVDDIHIIGTTKPLLNRENGNKWIGILNLIPSFLNGLLPYYIAYFKLFRKIKIDAFYFCDTRGTAYMLPAVFFKGKKILYLQSKNNLPPIVAKWLMLKFCDVVMCPSLDVFNSLPESDNKLVVNYGIDFDQYGKIDPENGLAEINNLLPPHLRTVPKLLYAGLIKPQKGIHHLIYAMGELKQSLPTNQFPVLFILGAPASDADIGFQNELKKYCEENNLLTNIFWLGRKDNVLEWMKNVDYFIFPTIDREKCTFAGFDEYIESTEASPVVLIESSLCNCFTLASRVTGVTDTITDYKNGLIYDPNEPGALSSALRKIILSKPQFIDFPNREKFSIEVFEDNIKLIFGLEKSN